MPTTESSPTDLSLAAGVSREFLLHHRVCPLAVEAGGALVVGIVEDSLLSALPDLGDVYGRAILTRTIRPAELERAILRLAAESARVDERSAVDESGHSEIRALANEPPVVRFVNRVVRDAFDAHASDVHLEALATGALAVRLRLDGVLTPGPEGPAVHAAAIVSRIKLLAELDIAERRRPQDGRIRVRLEERELDLRVSTVPTLHGESVVIRLLDQGERPVGLEELGMAAGDLGPFTALAGRAHGLLLVTGPTGSGKTTTLYAALARRRRDVEKVVTVEDPVEYQLAGVSQVPVHPGVGVTMGSVLRAILRQDPDVIMVGEMRDLETAEVAMQAALTGHLVLSTLHTTDAVGAVVRLRDLGIPDYLVAATLDGVLAQRLVRRVCPDCRVSYEPAPEQVALVAGGPVGSPMHVCGAGCARCRGTGFRGRVGLFELLALDDSARERIAAGAGRPELIELARTRGMRTLREDGWAKVRAGVTTVEEVIRVCAD